MRPSSRKLGRYSKNRRKAFELKVDIDRTTGNHPSRTLQNSRIAQRVKSQTLSTRVQNDRNLVPQHLPE
jgi:hypothetical protein